MLQINDQVYVDIRIDDKELPSGSNVIGDIDICEGNGMLFPQIALTLGDSASVLSRDQALTDGNKIRIIIARSDKDANVDPLDFRVFGGKSSPKNGQTVRIVGTLDTPDYIHKVTSFSFEGNSEDAIAKLCKECGVTFDGPSTFNGRKPQDSQVWLCIARKYGQSIQDITRRSWIDASSCMASVLTTDKKLILRNLFDVVNTPVDKITTVFTLATLPSDADKQRKVLRASDARDSSCAGFMNSWQNYGSTMVESGLNGKDRIEDKLDVKTSSKGLAINKDIHSSSKSGTRIDYAPVDCGNTNEKYERAQFQNVKGLALFSQRLSVLVYEPTHVKLFDPVLYRQADGDLAAPLKQSDVYVVVGRTRSIRGGRFYAERIEIAKPGVNMLGNSNVTGPSGVGSEASMIPNVTTNPLDRATYNKSLSAAATANVLNGAVQETTGKMQAMQIVVSNSINGGLSSVTDALNAIDSAAANVEDSIKAAISSAESVYNSAEGYYTYMKENVSNIGNMIVSIPGQLDGAARQLLSATTGGIMDMLGSCIPVVNQTSIFGRVFDKVRSKALDKVSDKLTRATTDQLNKVTNKLMTQQNKLQGTFTEGWNKSIGFIDRKTAEYSPSNSMYRLVDKINVGDVNDSLGMKRAISEELSYRPVARGSNWTDVSSVKAGIPEVTDSNLDATITRLQSQTRNPAGWFDA